VILRMTSVITSPNRDVITAQIAWRPARAEVHCGDEPTAIWSARSKLMGMPGEARDEESTTAAESYPILIRSYEPIADLDDRLERIFGVLSLPPREELNAPGPCVAPSTTRATEDLTEPSLGTGFGDRCGESEGDSGVSEEGERSAPNSRACRENGFASAIPTNVSRSAKPPW
jgi:hypothetical protein